MMRTRWPRLSKALLAAGLIAVAAVPAAGQTLAPTVADLLNNQVVHELRLSMFSRDWELLQARFMENTYYPVDVAWNGIIVRNAAVRSLLGRSEGVPRVGSRGFSAACGGSTPGG